jgi:uncharacterized protein
MSKQGIGWIDLTVDDATGLKSFYASVTGLASAAVSMGDYDDYVLNTSGGESVAGVCHRRGGNASGPAGWVVYFTVSDLDAAIAAADAGGGKVVGGPSNGMAFIQDPDGNHFALYQTPGD